jgi:hypothetical protein
MEEIPMKKASKEAGLAFALDEHSFGGDAGFEGVAGGAGLAFGGNGSFGLGAIDAGGFALGIGAGLAIEHGGFPFLGADGGIGQGPPYAIRG